MSIPITRAGAAAVLAAALALGAAACGGGNGGGGDGGAKGAKIALLLPESNTTRYEQQDRPNFERRVKELCANCEVIYANAEQDAARQQQGRALLEALKAEDKTSPSVAMINGAPTDSNAAPYKKGAHSILDAAGVKVAKEFDTPDWSPDKAQREMEQTVTSVGKDGFDGVYVANDGMAGGAIAALKGAGIDPASRPVTGQDAEVAAIQRILTGEQLMTVYQPIKRIAETAAELAVPLAQGKTPPAVAKARVNNGSKNIPSVLLDTIAVTKNNVKDTVIKDGFLTVDQICTADYAKACADAGIR